MKAGSAGSNPDGAITCLTNPKQPLRDFLGAVGEAVANLNTTVIGLDAVESGHQKPASLDISWSPHDRIAAARKARRFVLEAVLVRVAEALWVFALATAQLPRFDSIRGKWNGNTPRAERLGDVAAATLGTESHLAAGAILLIHWRNRAIHPHSRASLTPQQKKVLLASAEEIQQKFAGLSVDRLLEDFEAGRPTLKEISSLISMSITMVRQVDSAVNNLSDDDLDAMLMYYGLDTRIAELEAKTSPAKRQSSVLRMLQTDAPGLAKEYERLRMAR